MEIIKKYIFGVFGVIFHISGFLFILISISLIPSQAIGYILLLIGLIILLMDWYFLFINENNKKNLIYFLIVEIILLIIFFIIQFLEVPILKEEKNQFWKNLKTFLTFVFLTGIFIGIIYRTVLGYKFFIEKIERTYTQFTLSKYIIQILSLFIILTFLNLILQKWDFKIDLTPGYYSFSKNAQEIIKNIKGQNIRIFVFLPDQQLVQAKRDTTTSELYQFSEELRLLFKSIPNINSSLSVEFYNADLLESNHQSFGNITNGTILLRNYSKNLEKIPYVERRIYVNTFYDLEKLEQNLTRALLQIASDPVKIYFSTNYGERYISYQKKPYDLDLFVDLLKIYNFEIYEWNEQKGFPNKIPEDCQVLVFAGPTEKFSNDTIEAILEYIEKRSGKIAFFIDPNGKENYEWLFRNFSPEYQLKKANLIQIEGKPNLIYTDQIANIDLAQNIKNIERKRFLLIGKGYFEKQNQSNLKPKIEGYKVTEFLFSPFHSWIDSNNNKKKDNEENNQRFTLGIILEKQNSKVLLVSDVEWLTNRVLLENLYNLNVHLGSDILFYLSGRMNIPGILEEKRENQNIMISETDNIKFFILGIIVIPFSMIFVITLLIYSYNKKHKFSKETA